MNLYEIESMYEEAFEFAVDENGEIKDESLFNFLDEIAEAKEKKIENICIFYKNLLSMAEQIKQEKLVLADRQRILENKAERLKLYLEGNVNPGEKFEYPRAKISWRKSEQVLIDCDTESLPAEFQKIKVDADKTAIKNYLKDGNQLKDCYLMKKDNIQIK